MPRSSVIAAATDRNKYYDSEFVVEFATTSAAESVQIPLAGSVDVVIDWGDGTVEAVSSTYPTHEFAEAGLHTVRVTGSAATLGGTTSPSALWTGTVTAVRSFGDLQMTSFERAFQDVNANVAMPTVIPSTVTNMSFMFYDSSFNRDIDSWDVSSVENMSDMFRNSSFNQDIGSWNVSSVTTFLRMFLGASNFDQDISSWSTGNALSMNAMFQGSSFNQDISAWDFSGLDETGDLNNFMVFTSGLSATNYDALLIRWSEQADAGDLTPALNPNMGGSQVKSLSAVAARDNLINNYGWTITDGGLAEDAVMGLEFTTTSPSQQVLIPLVGVTSVDIDWGDGSAVETVTTDNPTHTYASAGVYDVQVTGDATQLGAAGSAASIEWRQAITAVKSFGDLQMTSFENAFRSVTANVSMPSVIPSTVTNMNAMFTFSPFNQDIGSWDVSNLDTMASMFYQTSFNQDIGNWDVSGVTNMVQMFRDTPFNQDISSWDTGSATSMNSMFRDADSFDQDISAWDFSGLNSSDDLGDFMILATGLSTTNYDALLIAWSDAADASTIFSPLNPDMGNSEYASVEALFARDNLITNYGWTISDGGAETGSVADSLVLWLDAADTSTITESSGDVSQWDDKSGNGNDVTQGTAALQPTTGTRTLNSLNVLEADGSTSMVNTSFGPFTQPNTIFLVGQLDIATGEPAFFDGGTSGRQIVFGRLGKWYLFAGTSAQSAFDVDTNAHVITGLFNGANSQFVLDGTVETGLNPGTSSLQDITLFDDATGSNNMDGIIAEILVFDSALSTSDREAVESALATKWGITLA